MSPALQAKLLRVLERDACGPSGAARERAVDVRVLAATHRDLRQRGRGGHVPRGSPVPPRRRLDRAAAAAPAPRRHPAARRALPRARRARDTRRSAVERVLARGAARAARLRAGPATCASSRTSSSAACCSPPARDPGRRSAGSVASPADDALDVHRRGRPADRDASAATRGGRSSSSAATRRAPPTSSTSTSRRSTAGSRPTPAPTASSTGVDLAASPEGCVGGAVVTMRGRARPRLELALRPSITAQRIATTLGMHHRAVMRVLARLRRRRFDRGRTHDRPRAEGNCRSSDSSIS